MHSTLGIHIIGMHTHGISVELLCRWEMSCFYNMVERVAMKENHVALPEYA